MDAVPREILQAAYQRKPIYLLKIPFLFALWGGLVALLWATKDHTLAIPIGLLCAWLVTNIIRGLGAIAHDAVHGTVVKNKTLAYLISLVCWSPTGMSVTVYANYHLHHHKITNTYPDVDNFVVTDYTRNPVLAKLLLLAVYSFGYPLYFMTQIVRYVPRLSTWKKIRMHLELAGIFGGSYLFYRSAPLHVFFFALGLPFILGACMASFTSMIEHYEMLPYDDDAYSSRTYGTKAPILNFFWNNVSYHNEHHKYPGIPWYNLRSFHEAAYPYYDPKVQAECYGGVWSVAFMLYKRILQLDISKLDTRYKDIDRDEERAKYMALQGIPAAEA